MIINSYSHNYVGRRIIFFLHEKALNNEDTTQDAHHFPYPNGVELIISRQNTAIILISFASKCHVYNQTDTFMYARACVCFFFGERKLTSYHNIQFIMPEHVKINKTY